VEKYRLEENVNKISEKFVIPKCNWIFFKGVPHKTFSLQLCQLNMRGFITKYKNDFLCYDTLQVSNKKNLGSLCNIIFEIYWLKRVRFFRFKTKIEEKRTYYLGLRAWSVIMLFAIFFQSLNCHFLDLKTVIIFLAEKSKTVIAFNFV